MNAEKLQHGSCSLSSINAGFSADGPCTHLMLGTQYAYLYDQEETHCYMCPTAVPSVMSRIGLRVTALFPSRTE